MKAFDHQPIFNKTVLENGVRVVTEHHPSSRATSAGIYVDLGTRDEPAHLGGAAHFIEHLVFKGTETRTAMDIAKSLEAVGGELNAYTSQEYTCFHACSLREHLKYSVDVLSDLVSHATFKEADYAKERDVVIQEIDMSADILEEYIFDIYFEQAYAGHSLGKSILGTKESLKSIDRKELFDFYRGRYHGRNMVVAVAGHVDHEEVVAWVKKELTLERPSLPRPERVAPKLVKFRKVFQRPSEQVHVVVGIPSSNFISSTRFEAYIINAILGGGMTSKLYQDIREEQGLAYAVYSYLHSFTDSGVIMTYAGTTEENLKKVIDSIYAELKRLIKEGISEEDLNFFKRQVKGQILLNADDIENRMSSLGVNEMVFGEYRTVESVVAEIDEVTQDSIRQYLDKYFDLDELSIIVMGEVDQAKTQSLVDSY